MTINDMIRRIREEQEKCGWWDEPRSYAAIIAMIESHWLVALKTCDINFLYTGIYRILDLWGQIGMMSVYDKLEDIMRANRWAVWVKRLDIADLALELVKATGFAYKTQGMIIPRNRKQLSEASKLIEPIAMVCAWLKAHEHNPDIEMEIFIENGKI